MIDTYLYKTNNKKRKEQIALCKLLNKKLEDLGYKVKNFNEEHEGSYFLTIFNNEKICGWNPSILCASCMANHNRRPIPIKWFVKMFDWFMNPKMNDKSWKLLEEFSYLFHNN